jgi:hypothetical protein
MKKWNKKGERGLFIAFAIYHGPIKKNKGYFYIFKAL